ncbi:related to NRK1-Nicotinamide riboside kinase [Serendipita indica DSM 11827]|uniref:Related to NRK1-Nicotinamide riboside kinase n=1 Tax=Serendipita indica (strain DSM 11827) TaxID=1109443 RepID=G4TRY6_SERID|nr:related to NRK1-Nicotinamide riboside kinase [Serendipita indica DSM 11827]
MSDTEQVNGSLKKRVIFVGVGGASCSGKTTLAKHLRSVLPGSFIIHQDDFAPPEQLVPVHPTLNVQDWDDPEGAIEWPRMVNFLRRTLLPVLEQSLNHWRAYFTQIQQKAAEEEQTEIIWALVDGFLLYWHPDVVKELDVRIFLRVTYDTLKKRRNERFGYHTAVQFSSEGSLWQDPPGYWDDIVWPAYLKAHKPHFHRRQRQRW